MSASTPASPQPLLIDVRSAQEFATIALVGAVHVPLAELAMRIRSLAPDPATPIQLYCASGGRSAMACDLLRRLGYQDVHNAGGLYTAAAQLQREIR